jgi:hypothetical protein
MIDRHPGTNSLLALIFHFLAFHGRQAAAQQDRVAVSSADCFALVHIAMEADA